MRQVYGAKELSDILGVSESKSYEYIRIMNNELKEKGFLTVARFQRLMCRKDSSE